MCVCAVVGAGGDMGVTIQKRTVRYESFYLKDHNLLTGAYRLRRRSSVKADVHMQGVKFSDMIDAQVDLMAARAVVWTLGHADMSCEYAHGHGPRYKLLHSPLAGAGM